MPVTRPVGTHRADKATDAVTLFCERTELLCMSADDFAAIIQDREHASKAVDLAEVDCLRLSHALVEEPMGWGENGTTIPRAQLVEDVMRLPEPRRAGNDRDVPLRGKHEVAGVANGRPQIVRPQAVV
jgi:hypothetical protein